MKIYLAGGMRGPDWRAMVKQSVPHHEYLNPVDHKLVDPREYKAWDLAAIRSADATFVHFSADNPSGFGLSVELGYAKALGKLTILSDERSDAAPDLARYIVFLRWTADVWYPSLDKAMAFLGTLPA